MNQKFALGGFALYLIPAAIWDLKVRSVPLWYLIAGNLAGAGAALAAVLRGETAWYAVSMSMMPGVFLLCISLGREKRAGAADGLMFLAAGLTLGIRAAFLLLMLSLILSSAASVLLLISKRASLRSRIPFLPFMAAGLLVMLIL